MLVRALRLPAHDERVAVAELDDDLLAPRPVGAGAREAARALALREREGKLVELAGQRDGAQGHGSAPLRVQKQQQQQQEEEQEQPAQQQTT